MVRVLIAVGLVIVGLGAAAGDGRAQGAKPNRTAVLIYTVTTSGESEQMVAGSEWRSSLSRVFRSRVVLKFSDMLPMAGDRDGSNEEDAPGGASGMPPSLAAAMQACAAKGAAAMACVQEAAAKACASASATEKAKACAFAKHIAQGDEEEAEAPPADPAKNWSGEFWTGASCEWSATIRDRTTETRRWDPLTKGPYVSKTTDEGTWSETRQDSHCGAVTIDRRAKTAELLLPLPRRVPVMSRVESPIGNSQKKTSVETFKDIMQQFNREAAKITATLLDMKSFAGSQTFRSKATGGTSTIETKVEWSFSLE